MSLSQSLQTENLIRAKSGVRLKWNTLIILLLINFLIRINFLVRLILFVSTRVPRQIYKMDQKINLLTETFFRQHVELHIRLRGLQRDRTVIKAPLTGLRKFDQHEKERKRISCHLKKIN